MRLPLKPNFLARWLPGGPIRRKRRGYAKVRGMVTHVIILDGTMSTLREGQESNAGLIYKLLAESLGPQLSIYYEAGIQWTSWRATHEVLLGRGINRQIRRAYGYLASRYRPGDRIYLFGYSRGAFAVRSLAGVIDRVGLLRQEEATERNVRQVWRLYQDGAPEDLRRAFANCQCHADVQVEMIGAFDTVKSLGLRLPLLWKLAETQHDFHSHALSSCVKAGFHALALEERREAYAPVMWTSDPSWSGRLEQVWFPGTHSDVGGQIETCAACRPLANIPLVWMLNQAELHGLPLPEGWRKRFPQDENAPSLGQWHGLAKLFLLRRDRVVGHDPTERIHESAIARGVHRKKPARVFWPLPASRRASGGDAATAKERPARKW